MQTRTTRTPTFLWYPPHDYPYDWVILDPKSKEDKLKVTKFKEFVKNLSIVEDTEQTRLDGQTDGRTDMQTDGQGETSIPPFQLRWSEGYNDTYQ